MDAIDEQARGFYARYGFAQLAADSRRLFLPLKSFYYSYFHSSKQTKRLQKAGYISKLNMIYGKQSNTKK